MNKVGDLISNPTSNLLNAMSNLLYLTSDLLNTTHPIY